MLFRKPDPDSVDMDAVCRAIAPQAHRNQLLRQLTKFVSTLNDQATLPERLRRLDVLSLWFRSPGKLPAAAAGAPEFKHRRVAKFELLVRVLEYSPGYRQQFRSWLHSLLRDSSAVPFFCRSGLPSRPNFLGEALDRLTRKVLPHATDGNRLGQMVQRLFPTEASAAWISEAPAELLSRFAIVLQAERADEAPTWQPLLAAVVDSVAVLTSQVAALGLAEDVRELNAGTPLRASPFLALSQAGIRALEARSAEEMTAAVHAAGEAVAGSRAALSLAHEALEQHGVSIDLVFRLEVAEAKLKRLEALVALLTPGRLAERVQLSASLLVSLNAALTREGHLRPLIHTNLQMLARKIVDRVGQTGEHYITSTRGEYFQMLRSAGGAGVITILTAAGKFAASWAHLAFFLEGILCSVDYAASFLLMQLLGFTLGSKQPAMTGAAIARALRQRSPDGDLEELTGLIARTCRSQLAAIVGNLALVTVAGVAGDIFWQRFFGHSFLDEDTAHYAIHALNPFTTGTLFYAALTGVLLWLSSVCGGWIENASVYRRLPEAIEQHRLRRYFGAGIFRWGSRVFAHNISGIGTNIAIGTLLGMTPAIGKFFGLPLEVRHITLSAGGLVLGAVAQGWAVLAEPDLYMAMLGIVFIGVLNLSVSFYCALRVAIRASETETAPTHLLGALVARFKRSPREFFLPPRKERKTQAVAAVAPPA